MQLVYHDYVTMLKKNLYVQQEEIYNTWRIYSVEQHLLQNIIWSEWRYIVMATAQCYRFTGNGENKSLKYYHLAEQVKTENPLSLVQIFPPKKVPGIIRGYVEEN